MNKKMKYVLEQVEGYLNYEIEELLQPGWECRTTMFRLMYEDPISHFGWDNLYESMSYIGYSTAYMSSVQNMDRRGCQYTDRLTEAFKQTETHKRLESLLEYKED